MGGGLSEPGELKKLRISSSCTPSEAILKLVLASPVREKIKGTNRKFVMERRGLGERGKKDKTRVESK